jgi:hypothetical protein
MIVMSTTAMPFDASKVVNICHKNDVAMLGVFGSVARGEATEQSDVDLLVRFSKQKSLLGASDLAIQIETAIGKRVDLFTEAAISPYIRDQVKRELQIIYET